MAVAGLNSRTQSDSSPSLGVRIMEQHLHQPGLLARGYSDNHGVAEGSPCVPVGGAGYTSLVD
ncbi:hypothetical protein L916_12742 [Phytophthora nicotianae]|uniref:Uncharacterized protein n=1 Tax=Phytophthora nicotianae TaxID=4792 RepID=W2ILW4_PHYNI|nr:hypothetical protein L916_12742 [Phytophthora nicotianae]